eukprot:31083-Pelagococcus_subviridis.AAC.17
MRRPHPRTSSRFPLDRRRPRPTTRPHSLHPSLAGLEPRSLRRRAVHLRRRAARGRLLRRVLQGESRVAIRVRQRRPRDDERAHRSGGYRARGGDDDESDGVSGRDGALQTSGVENVRGSVVSVRGAADAGGGERRGDDDADSRRRGDARRRGPSRRDGTFAARRAVPRRGEVLRLPGAVRRAHDTEEAGRVVSALGGKVPDVEMGGVDEVQRRVRRRDHRADEPLREERGQAVRGRQEVRVRRRVRQRRGEGLRRRVQRRRARGPRLRSVRAVRLRQEILERRARRQRQRRRARGDDDEEEVARADDRGVVQPPVAAVAGRVRRSEVRRRDALADDVRPRRRRDGDAPRRRRARLGEGSRRRRRARDDPEDRGAERQGGVGESRGDGAVVARRRRGRRARRERSDRARQGAAREIQGGAEGEERRLRDRVGRHGRVHQHGLAQIRRRRELEA